MATRTAARASGACAVAIVIAGCGAANTTTPVLSTTGVSTTASPIGQPAIERPLDATRYANAGTICELLTQEQAERLAVRDDDVPDAQSGNRFHTCQRSHHDGPAVDVVNVELLMSGSWLDRYAPGKGDTTTWITILGQPAVAYGPGGNQPTSCRLIIGLSEQQSAAVWVLDQSRNSCTVAMAVGQEIVQNLS